MPAKIRTLTCHYNGHTFERPSQKGRVPFYCDDHRKLGAAKSPELAPVKETAPDTKPPVTTEHYAFAELLDFLQDSENVYAYGPSGSGKTEGARRAAEKLGVAFVEQPCHKLLTADDLLGYNGPHGYMTGVIREWLDDENGGVLLLDEMDASNASLLMAINLASSLNVGQSMRFPDGERRTRTERHVMVGAGNTNGLGATDQYVGRSAIDRASLNRFAFLPWGYDETLERSIVATDKIGAEWVTFTQAVRRVATTIGAPLLVTPRNSIKGAKALRRGTNRATVENAYIWQGCDDDTKASVLAQL